MEAGNLDEDLICSIGGAMGQLPSLHEQELFKKDFLENHVPTELRDRFVVQLEKVHFAIQPYAETFVQALTCDKLGDHRACADKLWEAFEATTDLWSPRRHHIFGCYCTQLKQHGKEILTKSDWKKVKKTFADETETVLVRLEAGDTLAFLFIEEDQAQSLEFYREVLEVADTVTPDELNRCIFCDESPSVSVRDEIQKLRDVSQARLGRERLPEETAKLADAHGDQKDQQQSKWWFVDYTYTLGDASNLRVVEADPDDPELHRRVVEVGGCKCDNCLTPVEELGVVRLDFCSLCKAAYYCSKECQRAAWKNGHRKACRPPNVRIAGDIMRLVDGRLVHLVAKKKQQQTTEDDAQEWVVRLHKARFPGEDTKKLYCVKAEYLAHLRPAK